MRKNVLISTTRQWNPGDEFIMQGSLNALEKAFGSCFNTIIFNRNPDIRTGCSWRSKTHSAEWTKHFDSKYWKGQSYYRELFRVGQYDNSYKDGMDYHNIDLALFAGSPEWYGKRLIPMFRLIEKGNIPTVFLGIGAGDCTSFQDADKAVNRVLSQAKLITTRDRDTEKMLEKYHAQYLPCPALLSAKTNRLVNKVEKIGLIYATNKTVKGNNVSKEMHEYILALYQKLSKHYDVGLVCHYIDEINEARLDFPEMDLYYSYDSKDYADLYNNFDLVIGGRVHGIGMSASLGIPGIMISHDDRSSTTGGFLANSVKIGTSVEEIIDKINKISSNISVYSSKLIEHKSDVLNKYADLLRSSLK